MSSRQLAFHGWISSAADSHAKTCPSPEKALGSAAPAPGSGMSSVASSKRSSRRASSSRTSPPVRDVGCPTCGETCTCWGTEPAPSRFLLSTSERPTSAKECSCLLPTPTARARAGLLPTPTVKGNHNRKGLSPTSGDGLQTAVGGPLSPRFVEWLMGFPDGWTEIEPSEIRSIQAARRSRAKSSKSG